MPKFPVYLLLMLLLLGVACDQSGQPAGQTEGSDPETAVANTRTFMDHSLHLALPNWTAAEIEDENTVTAVTRNGQVVAVARFPSVPRAMGPYIADILPQYGPFQNIVRHVERPNWVWLEMDIAADISQRAQMHFFYCDGFTYQLTGSAPTAHFATFLLRYQQVLDSIQCDHQPQLAANEPGLVGLHINSSQEVTDFAGYRQAVVTARAAGVQATHTPISWVDIEKAPGEFDWTLSDLLLDTLTLEGVRFSLVINLIHTSVVGPRPDDLVGLAFDDSAFIARAQGFATAVAQRYGEQMDYLAFGNEVNIYLAEHPEQVAPFMTLFSAIKTAVSRTTPSLPTGTTLAFHTAVQQNRYDLIELFRNNDFLAYTFYPFGQAFHFDGDPDAFATAFDQMMAISGNTPFLIVENGWATSASLNSDEAKQAAYLRATFQTLAEQRSNFLWHIWYGFHDGVPEICAEAALSFVEPEVETAVFGETWTKFEAYLCTLGLRHSDGTPKLGWEVFMQEAVRFSGEQ